MIEKTICSWFKTAKNKTVYTIEPKSPPDEFIVFHVNGGSMSEHIKSSVVTFQCISSKSLVNAATMCEQLINDMVYDFVGSDKVCSVNLNSYYNYTDTSTNRYRYQAVFDIVHY